MSEIEKRLTSLENRFDDHAQAIDGLVASNQRIEQALIGDMDPDGNEGMVQKVRESDRLVKSARKWSMGALFAAIGAEAHNIVNLFKGAPPPH